MANQEKLTRAEVQADRLQQQCESLRAMEASMAQEKESVMRERSSQNLLLANLQAIQVIVLIKIPLEKCDEFDFVGT